MTRQVGSLHDVPQAETFESFYRREYSSLVGVAYALVGNRPSAEDLTQESFLTLHRHWGRVSGYDDPRAWLRRVLVNRATSFLRRRGAEWRAVARLGGHPAETSEISLPASEIWDEVRRLPRRQAQAMVLYYVGRLSVGEIGEVLEISRGAVKSHLHRARARLEKTLTDWREA